jgi:hypothetical protein
MAMREPIERPSGASQIVIHKEQYPLKVYLVFVFGLVLVAVAWGNRDLWDTQASSLPSSPAAVSAAQQTPYILERTVVVTATITSTPTLTSWFKTATAMPTPTRIPLQSSQTPTPSFRSDRPTNQEDETK